MKKNDFTNFKEYCKFKGIKPSHYTSLQKYFQDDVYIDTAGNVMSEDDMELSWSERLGGYVDLNNTDEPRIPYQPLI